MTMVIAPHEERIDSTKGYRSSLDRGGQNRGHARSWSSAMASTLTAGNTGDQYVDPTAHLSMVE
jgi:hypothetical protein